MRLAAGRLRDAEHLPVDMRGDTGEHLLGRGAEPLGPVGADEVVVAADAAGGDDHGLGAEFEGAGHLAAAGRAALGVGRLQDLAGDGVDGARAAREPGHPVPEAQLDQAAGAAVPHPALEGRDEAGAGAPGDVEAGHGVAVPGRVVAAALGPADDGEEPDALARAARTASRRPRSRRTPRPSGAASGPPSRSKPAVPSQSWRASSWLSWIRSRRCSGESTRKRPPKDQWACPPSDCSGSWSSRMTLRPGVDELRGGREAREPRPDHDHISVVRHGRWFPSSSAGRRCRRVRSSPAGQYAVNWSGSGGERAIRTPPDDILRPIPRSCSQMTEQSLLTIGAAVQSRTGIINGHG